MPAAGEHRADEAHRGGVVVREHVGAHPALAQTHDLVDLRLRNAGEELAEGPGDPFVVDLGRAREGAQPLARPGERDAALFQLAEYLGRVAGVHQPGRGLHAEAAERRAAAVDVEVDQHAAQVVDHVFYLSEHSISLFLELHGEAAQRPQRPQGQDLAEGDQRPVPPVGDDRAAPAPQGRKAAPGARIGRDEHPEPQPDALPAGREPVEVGGHARGAYGSHAQPPFVHLLGEGYGESPHVGLRGAVERQPREGHPEREGGHVEDAAPHPAADHLGGVEATELRQREVVQQDDPLDALRGGVDQVAEREDARVVDHHVGLYARGPGAGVELLGGPDARQVDRLDAHLRRRRAAVAGRRFEHLVAHRLQPLAPLARQAEPVAQRRQAQRIAAADAASGSRDQRPGAAGRNLSASHGYLILSSSRHSRAGISSRQLWQHCMSTEYMRAMQ